MAVRRVVVFPVRGSSSRWAWGVTPPPAAPLDASGAAAAAPPQSLYQIWKRASDEAVENALQGKGILRSAWNTQWNMSVITQHLVDKLLGTMEKKWVALGQTPEGSIRKRMHSMGEKMLAQINPTETFLKSVPKDASRLEITFPSSVNPKLVRRRVRRIALSGVQLHSRYMYGSLALLPLSITFSIVPVPNAPLFWNLYRAYANWQALQGSQKLLQFVNDEDSISLQIGLKHPDDGNPINVREKLVLVPCKKLDDMLRDHSEPLSDSCIATICQHYQLEYPQMLKWRDYVFKEKGSP